jgi:hypothetical protein
LSHQVSSAQVIAKPRQPERHSHYISSGVSLHAAPTGPKNGTEAYIERWLRENRSPPPVARLIGCALQA